MPSTSLLISATEYNLCLSSGKLRTIPRSSILLRLLRLSPPSLRHTSSALMRSTSPVASERGCLNASDEFDLITGEAATGSALTGSAVFAPWSPLPVRTFGQSAEGSSAECGWIELAEMVLRSAPNLGFLVVFMVPEGTAINIHNPSHWNSLDLK